MRLEVLVHFPRIVLGIRHDTLSLSDSHRRLDGLFHTHSNLMTTLRTTFGRNRTRRRVNHRTIRKRPDAMTDLIAERITFNPEQCGGRPCIRGMRIRVIDVLELLAAGLTTEQVLDELPDLEALDVQAALRYAARRLNHPVLVAA